MWRLRVAADVASASQGHTDACQDQNDANIVTPNIVPLAQNQEDAEVVDQERSSSLGEQVDTVPIEDCLTGSQIFVMNLDQEVTEMDDHEEDPPG
ncbi:hypothetical protein V6N13_107974 [Hibiscus sabdariffa]